MVQKTVISVPIDKNDLTRMTYTDKVIKESMRIFPPAPFIGRQLTEDLKIGLFTCYIKKYICINLISY